MTGQTNPSLVLTLTINGKDVTTPDGHTILQAAVEHGITIPTLCHLDGLSDIGACRLCLVEVKDNPKLLPACITPCREGMEVSTESPTLHQYRKMLIEMLLSEGNHVCSICEVNGYCDLQRLAQTLGVDHVELPYRFPHRTIDASHPHYVFESARCVLCMRCVRVCSEVEGGHNWDIMGRGIEAQLVSGFNQPWAASEKCSDCGKCVRVCPTGAMYERGKFGAEIEKERQSLPFLKADNRPG